MAGIERDPILGTHTPLQEGETLVAEFTADRMAYWRGHLILAVVLGTAAGLFLMILGNPYPVAGPFGAILASRVQPRLLLIAVAVVLIATSAYSIYQAWPFV